MSCGNCVAHVEEALLGVEGVSQASVDLESGQADVEGESIDSSRLVEAVAGGRLRRQVRQLSHSGSDRPTAWS